MTDDPKHRGTYGDGTVRTRKDGLLEKRIRLGRGADGKLIRKSVYANNLRELNRKARVVEAQHHAGLLQDGDSDTLAAHFEEWLKKKRKSRGARTIANYKGDYHRYFRDLAAVKLDPRKLTDELVEEWHTGLVTAHGAYTANRALRLLGNMLKDSKALRAVNPALVVQPATHTPAEIEILTADELSVFLPASRRSRLANAFAIALSTGLRHGEVGALRWQDVDVYQRPAGNGDRGELRVANAIVLDENGGRSLGPPKSKAARRTIGLTVEAVEALEAQRELLRAEELEESRLVFPNASGGLLDETNTARALRGVIDACNPELMEWVYERRREWRRRGLGAAQARGRAWQEAQALENFRELLVVKYVSFHDLRHTFASIMIAAGMDAPRLSMLLGHASVAFTMHTYVHLFEQMSRPAMPSISQFLTK